MPERNKESGYSKVWIFGLIPLAAVLLVVGVAALVFQGINRPCDFSERLLVVKAIPALQAKSLAATIGWGTSLFVYYMGFLAIMLTSIAIVWRSFDIFRPARRLYLLVVPLLVGTVIASLIRVEACTPQVILMLIETYFNEFHQRIAIALYAGIVAVAFATAASCAILAGPKLRSETRADHLKQQKRELRILLYIGSLFLMAGVFEIRTLFSTLLAHVHPFPVYENINLLVPALDKETIEYLNQLHLILKEIADGVHVAAGAVFTALLAAVYLPSALVLEDRLQKVAAKGPAGEKSTDEPESAAGKGGYFLWESLPVALTQMLNVAAAIAPFALGGSLDVLAKTVGNL